MSVEDPKTPQERLRRIEQETDELAAHMDEAREAVRRAEKADSMAMPGTADSDHGVVGGDARDEEPEPTDDGPGQPEQPGRS